MYNLSVSLLSVLSVALLSCIGSGETSAPNSPVFQLPEFQHFEKNEGQFDTNARFLLKRPGLNYWITDSGVTIDLYRSQRSGKISRATVAGSRPTGSDDIIFGHAVNVSIVNGKFGNFRPEGTVKTKLNVYKGGVAIVGQTRFEEVWRDNVLPGVNARYYVDGNMPRYDLVAAKPELVKDIQLRYEGAKNLRVSADGSLVYDTTLGEVREQGLTVFQTINGVKKPLSAEFRVTSKNQVGFEVRGAIAGHPVTIDPQVMRDATFFYANVTNDIETIGNGDIIFSGQVYSPNLPVSAGAYQKAKSAFNDGFFARMKPRLNELVYCTYFGGSDDDYEFRLARNPSSSSGNVYFGCQTYSKNLPVTVTTAWSKSPGGFSPYFGCISPDLGTLKSGTYFGTGNGDYFRDLTLSTSGNVYFILGTYGGKLGALPTAASYTGAFTTFPTASDYETYVGGLNGALSSHLLGVYVGGEGYDEARVITSTPDGTLLVAGDTTSRQFRFSGRNLSGTAPFQSSKVASTTVFVARLRTNGMQQSATYFGGSSDSYFGGLTVNSANEPIITGRTDTYDLPRVGPTSIPPPDEMAFIAKFGMDLNSVTASRYLTGIPTAIKVDDLDRPHIVGTTFQSNFLTVGDSLRTSEASAGSDAYLMILSTDLASIVGSSPIGGEGYEYGSTLAIGAAPWRNVMVLANNEGGGSPILTYSPSFPPYLRVAPDWSSSLITTIGCVYDPYEIKPSVSALVGGTTTFVQVRLNLPAGSSGVGVTFTSSNPSVLTLRDANMVIPVGGETASNKVITQPVAADTNVTITATGPQGISVSTVITVKCA